MPMTQGFQAILPTFPHAYDIIDITQPSQKTSPWLCSVSSQIKCVLG